MKKFICSWLLFFQLCATTAFADTIYMIGYDNNGNPAYWTIVPPGSPSTYQELDKGSGNTSSQPLSIAISPNQTAYIVGNTSDSDDDQAAAYWTIPHSGTASNINLLCPTSDVYVVTAYGIAYTPSGTGYIVGRDQTGFAAYWTVSSTGVVSSSTALPSSALFGSAVGFTPSGTGYIAGLDGGGNVVYWAISPTGVISDPVGLVGGEAGGAASAYAVASTPSGTTYIVGNNKDGYACYWTISSLGVASSANVLDGVGTNSQARGIAFLPNGQGIMVGQNSGNVSSYWLVSSNGTVGTAQALTNGSGSGSYASGVAYTSDEIAYIVGTDNANQAVYWTLGLSDITAEYHLLDSGGFGACSGIAISLGPNPPQNLTGNYVRNDFGWMYEDCVTLHWTPSSSTGVVAYNIYRNGVKIGTVSSSTTEYDDHNQKRSVSSTYGVTAVDGSGNESILVTIII